MATDDERFLQRLLATFRLEADEHVGAMSALVLELERPDEPGGSARAAGLVETLFREVHSLKGAARAVNLADIEAVCQALESVLALLKRAQCAPPVPMFELLYLTIDVLRGLLDGGAYELGGLLQALTEAQYGLSAAPAIAGTAPLMPPLPMQPMSLTLPMSPMSPMAAVSAMPAAAAPSTPAAAPEPEQTVRISTAKLTALLLQAEELLAFKFSAEHMAADLRALHTELEGWRKHWSRTVGEARAIVRAGERRYGAAGATRKGPPLERLLEAVERDALLAKTMSERFVQIERSAWQERRALAGMVDNLLEDMKRTLMLPFSTLLEMAPRLVRDLAHDSGKEVELRIDGAAIEIDRRILEQMRDPLVHLLRNAIDHGIETPAERRLARKQERARLSIEVLPRDGDKVELLVSDDGRGIDPLQVRDRAVREGLLAPEAGAALSTAQMLALVFESGVSTSAMLTDLSGRGLGLAIVREKAEKLGGSVAAEAAPGGGTRFRIVLPATLATFRGLLVTAAGRQFVLPSRNVERVARVLPESVQSVEGHPTVVLEGEVLALVQLWRVLGLAAPSAPSGYLTLALLTSGSRRMACLVDAVLGEQEVLVKGLGPQLRRVPNIAGATVLGAGQVVPILHVADLLKSALGAGVGGTPLPAPAAQAARQQLLVVEDSITSRALLKNMLEVGGYRVTVAVDGVDALSALRGGGYDLVVSDVEMPRMDGFDLTASIRADRRLAELPVVLVTSLASREHRERGVDVGASAYIAKQGLEQGNLLATVRRLLR
ncbi:MULTISPECIES: response regulator [unclassified Duganella]|uniref:hybrid sensor histidine kinase/response regulator n=1 Tax=unclassified Duganella TaxID=2636909 RepID=UPI000E34808B|nr:MULTISPECIES: response regulator [unclassified Duganella]RFP14781.1 hybrid sensor histidine kinase/response regulator [Duganella sp. BJB475]RFP31130.1 hybrid sensor histidine kinase/response regulator [Duganella sp. BJB476]